MFPWDCRWEENDYGYIHDDYNIDAPSNAIIKGTFDECKSACERNSQCVGFTRESEEYDNEQRDCYLKKSVMEEAMIEDFEWRTIFLACDRNLNIFFFNN